MANYITLADFLDRFGITVAAEDRINDHIAAASRKVDAFTGRQFGPHTGAATARTFRPVRPGLVYIDDSYDIDTVAIDDGTGTYPTEWAATDFETDPPNGIGPDGQSGWPASAIRAVGGYSFTASRRSSIQVTGKWGWAAVPAPVIEATYLIANRLYYEVKVPGGVTPPNIEFGIPGAPLQRPYTAEGLLEPYKRRRGFGVA